MLPVAIVAAVALLPPNDTALRYSVRGNARGVTAVELLAEKLRAEAVELREGKNPTDALSRFNAAVLLNPDDPNARIGRAKTFGVLGRFDESDKDYAEVLARNPFVGDAGRQWRRAGSHAGNGPKRRRASRGRPS